MPKSFKDLSEREILALAITLEEEDGRTYGDMADALQKNYPASAKVFEAMIAEEAEHRRRLTEQYRGRFGDHIIMIRRTDIKGFVKRRPMWLIKNLSLDHVRKEASSMEMETRNFYQQAATKVTDAGTRQLLIDLAEAERRHVNMAEALEEEHLTKEVREQEDKARRRLFVLQVIQPGLAGLMDGSVSTLAPLFAAAFAAFYESQKLGVAYQPLLPFKIGLAASIGAGISMGFAEALSDDGSLTGRGRPLIRGIVCGLMTTAGGIGHTLPYLIPHFWVATIVAFAVVLAELAAISWIRHRFMEAPWLSAAIQVIIGGIVVLLAGVFIGS
jgi:erythrin-vacuolar iron transport family protein